MDYYELGNCNRRDYHPMVCKLNQPIISTEDSGSCSVELLTELHLANCDYRIMNIRHEMWLELQPNFWSFIFPTAEEVRCESVVDNQLIIGSGTLFVQAKCSISTKHVRILGSEKYEPIREKVQVRAQNSIVWKDIVDAVSHQITNQSFFFRNSLTVKTFVVYLSKLNECP